MMRPVFAETFIYRQQSTGYGRLRSRINVRSLWVVLRPPAFVFRSTRLRYKEIE